ncbi:MAG: sigma-70 family RNA polymerase sigma factor [Acidobacteria bacterium]|nr:MAG: sigma-70 family RNA polymerase sigma factor [Acidobacteriota bacterium]
MVLLKPAIPSAERLNDGDLVVRACRGDDDAQNELARRHRRSAFFLALQLLGNRDDALDVAQDAMLRFFSTLHRFDPRRPVRPWLFKIVRNRIHDLRRRRRVRKHDSIDQVDEDGRRFELTDLSVDLEGDAARAQLRRLIWQALKELSHNQREIMVLRDYQDLSYAEIASTLGIPIGTVMSRLHAARKRLRQILQDDLRALAR